MIRNLIKSSTPINNINLIKIIKTNQLNKKNLKQNPNSTIRENDICAYGKQLISQNKQLQIQAAQSNQSKTTTSSSIREKQRMGAFSIQTRKVYRESSQRYNPTRSREI